MNAEIMATVGGFDYDPYEVAQTIAYPKAGYLRKMRRNHKKKTTYDTYSKKYKLRRASIKRGELGWKARYGKAGHSSWWW